MTCQRQSHWLLHDVVDCHVSHFIFPHIIFSISQHVVVIRIFIIRKLSSAFHYIWRKYFLIFFLLIFISIHLRISLISLYIQHTVVRFFVLSLHNLQKIPVFSRFSKFIINGKSMDVVYNNFFLIFADYNEEVGIANVNWCSHAVAGQRAGHGQHA